MDSLIPLGVLLLALIVGAVLIGVGVGTDETGTDSKGGYGYSTTEVKNRRPYLIVWGNCLVWPSLVLLVIYLPTFLALFLTSWGDVKGMEAFYRDTLTNYEYAVTATEQVEIQGYADQEGVITDLTYQQQGMVTGERIKEMRDKTEWYNRTLRRLESANGVPVIGWLFHDVPGDLKPIILD